MTTDATRLREEIIARLDTLPGYEKKARRTPLPQQQPSDLPQLSVFIMGERLTADGDANAGEPSFNVEITIGISDMRGFKAPDVLDGQNDAAVDLIEARLLCDPTFTLVGAGALFEGVSGINRRRVYPQDGETYFAELRLEMTFHKQVVFDTTVLDALRHVNITAHPADAPTDVRDIKARVDLPGP